MHRGEQEGPARGRNAQAQRRRPPRPQQGEREQRHEAQREGEVRQQEGVVGPQLGHEVGGEDHDPARGGVDGVADHAEATPERADHEREEPGVLPREEFADQPPEDQQVGERERDRDDPVEDDQRDRDDAREHPERHPVRANEDRRGLLGRREVVHEHAALARLLEPDHVQVLIVLRLDEAREDLIRRAGERLPRMRKRGRERHDRAQQKHPSRPAPALPLLHQAAPPVRSVSCPGSAPAARRSPADRSRAESSA